MASKNGIPWTLGTKATEVEPESPPAPAVPPDELAPLPPAQPASASAAQATPATIHVNPPSELVALAVEHTPSSSAPSLDRFKTRRMKCGTTQLQSQADDRYPMNKDSP